MQKTKQSIPYVMTLAAVTAMTAAPATAQEKKESVIIPSEMELSDEQRADLQKMVEKDVTDALSKCIGGYPRPEFFAKVFVEYTLRKTGQLRGGYIGGNAPDPNMYVASDEERAKQEEAGSFTRMVVRADKDLDKCMKKNTGKADTGLDRYSAKIAAEFEVKWSGKTPTVTAKTFDVAK